MKLYEGLYCVDNGMYTSIHEHTQALAEANGWEEGYSTVIIETQEMVGETFHFFEVHAKEEELVIDEDLIPNIHTYGEIMDRYEYFTENYIHCSFQEFLLMEIMIKLEEK